MCLQAHHKRQHQYVPQHNFIPGGGSVMATICSWEWHLTEAELLACFDHNFPHWIPWKLYHIPCQTNSALTLSFYSRPLATSSIQSTPDKRIPIGSSRFSFTQKSKLIRSSPKCSIISRTYKFLPSAIDTTEFPPRKGTSHLCGYLTYCAQLVGRSKGWGPWILD